MTNMFTDMQIGNYKLINFEITPENRGFRSMTPYGKYVRITNCGEVVMSNTEMEEDTNREIVQKAHGDVLIAGLGIGMIILAIQDKAEVRTITVIEKSAEIIDMVIHQLPLNHKVEVIEEDIFTWEPEKGFKYDTIYFDIWNYINSDIYEEMKELKKMYRKRQVSKQDNPNRFMACWAEHEAKNNLRL